MNQRADQPLPHKRLRSLAPALLWWLSLALCVTWNYSALLEVVPYCHRAYILGWDPNGYFAWGRSIAVDGDVDFFNDFTFLARMGGFGPTQESFAHFMAQGERTPTGRIPNIYGIGMGLLALPALYAARGAAFLCGRVTGLEISKFAAVYALAFILTSILIGFAGLWVSLRILTREYGERIALQATVLGTVGMMLGYYIWYEPFMAHAVSFACVAFFVAVALWWLRAFGESLRPDVRRRRAAGSAFLMGIVLGVAAMVRLPNAALALFPAVLAVAQWRQAARSAPNGVPRSVGPWVREGGINLCVAALGAVIAFLPQMIAWKILYGSFVYNSYESVKIYPYPRHLFQILFGARNSLFLWTSLALVACAGLAMAVRRCTALAVAGATALAAELWIYGAWDWYWLESSFGMRGMADYSLFFFIGLAETLRRLSAPGVNRRARLFARAAICLLVTWNLYFMICYRAGIQGSAKPFAGRRLFASPSRWMKQAKSDLTKFGVEKYVVFTVKDPFDENL